MQKVKLYYMIKQNPYVYGKVCKSITSLADANFSPWEAKTL